MATVSITPKVSVDWKQRTAEHHAAHPEIYTHIVNISRKARLEKKFSKVSMELIVNLLRWDYGVGLNQNFNTHYARMIEAQEPDLKGFFNFRKNPKYLTPPPTCATQRPAVDVTNTTE